MPGFSIHPKAIPEAVLAELSVEAERLALAEPNAAHGIRDLLRKSALIRSLASSNWLRSLLPADMICVRGILFDKTPESNWLVPWHQDLTIALKEQLDTPGYGPWSIKHGVPHVQAPAELLQQMLTLRLHLDDAGPQNGALRVIPGSHADGILNAEGIAAWRERVPEVVCTASAGDVLAIKPLLLHASSKATSAAHRRVVHLEFAPAKALAPNLAWHESRLFNSLALWLDNEAHHAALNMAIDDALLEQATMPVLRIYHWAEPSISIGYGQKMEALAADLPPWPIVRRRTGGGAVLHDEDSTYSLIVPACDPWAQTRPIESYRLLHASLAHALQTAGHGPCRLASAQDQCAGAACFQSPALHDIMLGTSKVAGAGQRRTRQGLLHQGSVRIKNLTNSFWQTWAESLASEVTLWPADPQELLQRAACSKPANAP